MVPVKSCLALSPWDINWMLVTLALCILISYALDFGDFPKAWDFRALTPGSRPLTGGDNESLKIRATGSWLPNQHGTEERESNTTSSGPWHSISQMILVAFSVPECILVFSSQSRPAVPWAPLLCPCRGYGCPLPWLGPDKDDIEIQARMKSLSSSIISLNCFFPTRD